MERLLVDLLVLVTLQELDLVQALKIGDEKGQGHKRAQEMVSLKRLKVRATKRGASSFSRP